MGCTVNQLSNDITRLLDMALEHEQIARAYRKQAGEALIASRSHGKPKWRDQLDERTASLLIKLATGRE